ncbi:hypothetical protein ACTWPT_41185 [Nonomuraea sp. 3N208]
MDGQVVARAAISRPTSDQTDAVPVSTSVATMSCITPQTSWHDSTLTARSRA